MSTNGGEGDIGASGCCVPESEMLVIRDRNMDYPWKGGNKYARVCPSCGKRQFCAKSYWKQRYHDPEATAYIVRKGDDTEPVPVFECPFEDCTGMLVGFPDECEACKNPIEWDGLDDDEGNGEDTENQDEDDQDTDQ